jgi:beta-galactosidase/beta-glucuronidase
MVALLLSIVLGAALTNAADIVSLAGEWRFHFDRDDAGVREAWFKRPLTDAIMLPSSTDEAGKGKANGPELGQSGRLMRAFEYVGPAWYQREVDVPAGWDGKQIFLFLERAHWESRLWIDDQEIGMQDSLSVPH